MRQSVNFFKSTEGITRSLARLTSTSRSLSRRLNRFTELMMMRPLDDVVHRDAVTRKTTKYVYRASRRVAVQVRKLQRRTHTLTEASDALIEWFRARSADDRITAFALTCFRQIAAASIEQQRAFRNALATSPAMLQHFDTARAALVASLDVSIHAMLETVVFCDAVLQALGMRNGRRESMSRSRSAAGT